ncbi:MAG: tetratricopeptide repeat protein [Calditrichaeota bacterium]|nr:tetratricopeptide repeat protein [Calditrichota bacterium]
MNFNDDASSYANKAFEYLEKGDKENAIKNALIAIEIRPRDPDVYLDIANIYFNFSDYKLAIKYYKKAIKREVISSVTSRGFGAKWEYRRHRALNNVKNFKAYGWLGKAYREIGKLKQANKAFNKALRYAEDNNDSESIELIRLEIESLKNRSN